MDITEQVSEAKKELRRTLAALRMEQLAALDAAAGEALWAKVEALPEFISAGTVLLYSALPDEIPTEGVLRRWSGCFLQEDGDADGPAKGACRTAKRLVLPVVCGERLELREYDPLRMVEGYRGIFEPSAECAVVEPSDIDFAIIPGIAFDLSGGRLGRGGGFYDKLIPQLHCPTVAVALPCQIVEKVPCQRWDATVGRIIF